MPVIIRHVAFANGLASDFGGQYIKSFDHEAFNGRGEGEFTDDINEAMKFASKQEALEFYLKAPKCKPTRPDGTPNRPMTASTVSIENVEE